MTPWAVAHQASLSFIISQSLLKLMSIELMMPSNHLILCCPLLLLPSIFPRIRVFYSDSALCIRWPKYWSFSFSINHSNEYSRLISFRIDYFDLLAFQGTIKKSSPAPQFKSINYLSITSLLLCTWPGIGPWCCGPWLLQTIILLGIILKERKIFLLNFPGKSPRAYSRLAWLGPSLNLDLNSR